MFCSLVFIMPLKIYASRAKNYSTNDKHTCSVASEGYCISCGKPFRADILGRCLIRLRQNLSFVIIPLTSASIAASMTPPRPWQLSAPPCARKWTWSSCASTCSTSFRRPCSQLLSHCGYVHLHHPANGKRGCWQDELAPIWWSRETWNILYRRREVCQSNKRPIHVSSNGKQCSSSRAVGNR